MSTEQYRCDNHSLEYPIAEREARAAQENGLELERRAMAYIMHRLMIEKDKLARDVFFDPATFTQNTTLVGTQQWNDTASSDIFGDIDASIDAVTLSTGKRPNVGIVGKEVFDKMRVHPDVTRSAALAGTTPLAMVDHATLEVVLGKLFGLERLYVGSSVKNSGSKGDPFSGEYIWDKHAWFGWLNPAGMSVSDDTVAAVKTIGTRDFRARTYFEDQTEADILNISSIYTIEACAPELGYLIINAVA